MPFLVASAVVIGVVMSEAFIIHGVESFSYSSETYPFNSFSRILQSLLVSGLCVGIISDMRKDPMFADVHKTALFWVCASLTAYFSVNFLLFAHAYKISNQPDNEFLILWSIFQVTVIFSNGLMGVAFVRIPRNRQL